jgi:hypothetical protein
VDDAHAFHDAAPSAERILEQDAQHSRWSARQRWESFSAEIL